MKRINITLDEQTITRLEQLGNRYGLDRSSTIRMLAAQASEKEEKTMSTAEVIRQKLGISREELNSMFTAVPVSGFVGTEVVSRIASQHNIDLTTETLGAALAAAGVLTEDEGEWLDD